MTNNNMSQRYHDYALYNIWANNRLIDTLLKQDKAMMTQEIAGSFPNIRETVKHIWFAETGWLSRLRGLDWKSEKVDNFQGNTEELFAAWQETSEEFRQFTEKENLEKVIEFERKGQTFFIPSREIAQTVFNHGTYHRGQIVMMMRQSGVTEIPQTDYIEWVRTSGTSL